MPLWDDSEVFHIVPFISHRLCLYVLLPALPFAAQPLRADEEKRRAVNILESVGGTANCRSGQKRAHLFADLARGTTKRLDRNMRRGAQSEGIRLARYTLRNHLPSFCQNFGRFLLKPDTQLRVSPCFSSQTQPACPFPNSRIFPVRGNQLHPPRSTKINVPTAFTPRTHKLYHIPPPRVNRRAPSKVLARSVKTTGAVLTDRVCRRLKTTR